MTTGRLTGCVAVLSLLLDPRVTAYALGGMVGDFVHALYLLEHPVPDEAAIAETPAVIWARAIRWTGRHLNPLTPAGRSVTVAASASEALSQLPLGSALRLIPYAREGAGHPHRVPGRCTWSRHDRLPERYGRLSRRSPTSPAATAVS